jgi:hypothetical protein
MRFFCCFVLLLSVVPIQARTIKQETSGPQSPAISNVEGDLSIRYGISEERFERLAKEFGVAESALKSFFKILAQKQVPLEDLDSKLREIAKHYQELQIRVQTLSGDDPEVAQLKHEAQRAIDTGDYDRAEALLNDASARAVKVAQELEATMKKQFLAAAQAKTANGYLKNMQLDYAEATAYYLNVARNRTCLS